MNPIHVMLAGEDADEVERYRVLIARFVESLGDTVEVSDNCRGIMTITPSGQRLSGIGLLKDWGAEP